ncbi:MAG: element excision factor XisH family protein [Chitinophagales bacterium]
MARDIIHEAVKNALIKEDWIITDDPFKLDIGTKYPLEVDLAAEKILAAEKEEEKILVEIKSFAKKSMIYEFHEVLGQYLNYEGAVELNELNRIVFLAISEETFLKMNTVQFINLQLKKFGVKIIVVDILDEKIVQWIK